jgi:hypothetical protein
MNTPIEIVLVVASLGLAVLAGVWAAIDRAVPSWQFVVAACVEIIALVLVIVTAVALITGHGPEHPALFIAYLVGLLLVLPIGALLALAEPTRYGAITLAVAALVVCVLIARLNEIWSAAHG